MLSADNQRLCFKHLAYPQVTLVGAGVGSLILATTAVNMLQLQIDSLTAAGETNVLELLPILETKWTALSTADRRYKAEKVGTITLNAKEWEMRVRDYDAWRRKLAVILHVELDPPSRADDGMAGGAFQGPFREP